MDTHPGMLLTPSCDPQTPSKVVMIIAVTIIHFFVPAAADREAACWYVDFLFSEYVPPFFTCARD